MCIHKSCRCLPLSSTSFKNVVHIIFVMDYKLFKTLDDNWTLKKYTPSVRLTISWDKQYFNLNDTKGGLVKLYIKLFSIRKTKQLYCVHLLVEHYAVCQRNVLSTLYQRNLKTQQSAVILDLYLRKNLAGNYSGIIVFEKPHFQVFSFHTEMQSCRHFKFFLFQECFWKAPLSRQKTNSVDLT